MTIRTFFWLFAAAALAQEPQSGTGTWSPFAKLRDARYDACAVRLGPGQILITGGTGVAGTLATSEILNADGTLQAAASMNTPRARHTCTPLGDGRVLVATGGADNAEVYDPKADAWTAIDGNGESRSGATATLLPDGRVLIAGGSDGDTPVATLEIFDPATNLLLVADAQLEYPRSGHAAALLVDGRVAIMGGDGGAGPLRSVEFFDPVAVSIAVGPDLNTARSGHSATALEDGRVLVAGGSGGSGETDTAEVLDAAAEGWTTLVAHLNVARTGHFALLVPGNGGVLLGGGSGSGQPLAATELFQPADDSFLALGSLTAPRSGLAGAPLDDGLVLAMGGTNSGGPQSACGILPLPALTFSAGLYHPLDTAKVSGSNFPANATIPLTLELVQGTSATAIPGRLLTASVATGGGALLVNFGQVPVVNAASGDAGQQFRLTARLSPSIAVVRNVPVKVVTTLSIPLPASVLEGSPVTFPMEVKRTLTPGPLTGTLTATFGNSTVATALKGSGTPVTASFARTNLAAGLLSITATYSGDTLNDASTATASYTVASKTPIVELTSSLAAPQVGVPFTLFPRVRVNGNVPNGPPIAGAVTILESGVPIGTAKLVTSLTTPTPNILDSFQFTALSFAPLRFTASFAGDSVYRSSTTAAILSPVLQKAQTTLSLNPTPVLFSPTLSAGQPLVFQCGAPTQFTGVLRFPVTLGLSNRMFSLNTAASDGSVRSLGSAAAGTLVPSATQLGAARGDASVILPFNTASVTASFSGDTFLQPSTSGFQAVTVQPVPVNVQFSNLPSTATNPLKVSVTVANNAAPGCAISGPQGTVEFFDGAASLGIVALPANTTPISQIIDGTSNTIQFGESGKLVSLVVSRPVGVHNLKAHYSGDAFHAAADSPVVPVTFQ